MLNIYTDSWDLDAAICPCDVHFLDYLEAHAVRGAAIFHFGTGRHHIVGVRNAESGTGTAILGITASPGEYEAYVQLAIARPEVVAAYKVFFGDIYQLDARLLPEFDLVTLFHLCEFRGPNNDAYGAMTDLELALVLTDRLRLGGRLLLYTRSQAYEQAVPVIEELLRRRALRPDGSHKTLSVLRKIG